MFYRFIANVLQSITAEQIPQCFLKIFIIKEIDKRIHSAIKKNHDNGESIVSTVPVNFIPQSVDQIENVRVTDTEKEK